ncbi:A/G-specific adenine glycosylase [Candidatus Woesearchaeota archaeon]|nr:MAG: A/G-specific adenine glycosylase [Candidatus Woesearchaeota archaeon]
MQREILEWYAQNRRDLPWRKTCDVYRVLVSEMMLQQTQVGRVLPKYGDFLQKFPTAKALAGASPADVIVAWSGLGYNRRALFLQRAAQVLAREIPSDLRELPGVGEYTARAVECFAFGRDVAVVDTNVRRIFSRVFFSGKGTVEKIDEKVRAAVPEGRGVDWNNALMDFGSLVCTAKSPKCGICPLKSQCLALRKGTQDAYLRVAPRQKPFVGSRRFYRGRILRLAEEPRTVSVIAKSIKKSPAWTEMLVKELAKEGLVKLSGDIVSLPTSL